MEGQAREHLAAVGPKMMLLESVEGLIEAHDDQLQLRVLPLESVGCDPNLTNEYAALCFRMALDALCPEERGNVP